MPRLRIGVDVGGTFTDICVFEEESEQIHIEKVPSTPKDSSEGIASGLESVLKRLNANGRDVVYLAHGTTVSTNTLIQHSGASTGLITTRGFRDLLEIARQTRPDLYDPQVDKPQPLVPRKFRLEVTERVYADGRVLTPLDEDEVREAVEKLKTAGVEAVAVCLLHAYLVPDHEKRIKSMLNEMLPGAYLSVSHEIVPEFREYERLSTTVVNAYLGLNIDYYMTHLERLVKDLGIGAKVYVTQSNGGLISTARARKNPVNTVLSGPSTGVIGSASTSRLAGFDDIITFDMGGTSTDVCLVENCRPHVTNLREIEGYAVKTPMIDVHTVGAGGGSIAWIDSGGHLKVGPQSAGSEPGPVCYGKGGATVTVTDANVVLQTLNPKHLLGGRMAIDADASKKAVRKLAGVLGLDAMDIAKGIISLVVANMVRAIRVISVQRGYDPRNFTLVGFGGAGPLHAGWVARELNIKHILIPKHPGIECAFGILVADMRADFTRTKIISPEPKNIDEANSFFQTLENQARDWLLAEGLPPEQQAFRYSVDMRYQGQNFELTIPMPTSRLSASDMNTLLASFFRVHEQNYGYSNPGAPTQLITYRVEALGLRPKINLKPKPPFQATTPSRVRNNRRVYFGQDLGGWVNCDIYWREDLVAGNRISGPAMIEQMDTTTLLLPGHAAEVDDYLNFIIHTQEGSFDAN